MVSFVLAEVTARLSKKLLKAKMPSHRYVAKVMRKHTTHPNQRRKTELTPPEMEARLRLAIWMRDQTMDNFAFADEHVGSACSGCSGVVMYSE